ncbi:MAG: phage/plasmid replication domain-containing protein [Mobilitalea sp.]
MIDTVVLRLHDLNTHKDIYDLLNRPDFNTVHKKSKVLNFERIEGLPAHVVRDIVHYGDSGSEQSRGVNGKIQSPSSHYKVYFNINDDKDYVEFNYSIPKYFYGNNIAQFVKPVSDKSFVYGNDKKFNVQKKHVFNRLITAINYFFKDNFIDCPVDYTKLEINRVDICYNQIFSDKSECMRYLNYQKKMNLKNMRLNGRRFQNYNTSIMYTGKEYSVKIYHKGSEFAKNDAKELEKLNSLIIKQNVPDYFKNFEFATAGKDFERMKNTKLGIDEKDLKGYKDLVANVQKKMDLASYSEAINRLKKRNELVDIEFLQNLADNILRYEMTFRKVHIGNIYKKKYFRKNDSVYTQAVKEFEIWWLRSFSGSKLENIPKDFKKTFKYIIKWKRKVLTPYRDVVEGINYRNHFGGIKHLEKIGEFKFNDECLEGMVDEFRKFFLNFQVKYADCEETFMGKVINHNKEAEEEREKWRGLEGLTTFSRAKMKKKLNTLRMRMIYQTLKKYGSWENILKSGEFTESTYHRYKSEFKMLGLEKNYISSEIFNPETEYEKYYNIELFNQDKLKIKL